MFWNTDCKYMKIMYVHCGEETNITNRPTGSWSLCWISYIRFFTTVYIWFSYICSHYSSLGRFIRIQHNNQYLVGLLTQLLERCTGIVEVIGSNPVRAWFFFRSYFNYYFSGVHSWEGRLYSFWNELWMYIRTQSVRSSNFFFCRKRSTI